MDLQDTQRLLLATFHELSRQFHRVPGSAILLRYIKSSYQNDPIRSAVELFLFLFAVHYLLAPKYSTKPGYLTLTEEVRVFFLCFLLPLFMFMLMVYRRLMIWWRIGRRSRLWRSRPHRM